MKNMVFFLMPEQEVSMRQVVIFLTVALLCVALYGCSDNESNGNRTMGGGNTENLKLVVTPSKTIVENGETIEITATLKNLSGKDIFIELIEEATAKNYELEDILYIAVVPANTDWHWGVEDPLLIYWPEPELQPDLTLPRPNSKKTIEKDAVITHTVKYTFDEPGKYDISSMVFFYFDDGERKIDGELKMSAIESRRVSVKVK